MIMIIHMDIKVYLINIIVTMYCNYKYLGAACGSPYIVFISTYMYSMLHLSDIYIYIIRVSTHNRNNEFILKFNIAR